MEKSKRECGRAEEDLLDYSERHNLPVLNAADPTEEVRQLLEQSGRGEIVVKRVGMFEYKVPALRGFTVIPVYQIEKTEKADVDNPPAFDGDFICEEYHGGLHPMLIVPADMVEPTDRKS